jgi:hypothetical protein
MYFPRNREFGWALSKLRKPSPSVRHWVELYLCSLSIPSHRGQEKQTKTGDLVVFSNSNCLKTKGSRRTGSSRRPNCRFKEGSCWKGQVQNVTSEVKFFGDWEVSVLLVSHRRLLDMGTSSVYARRRARLSCGVVTNPSTLHWWRHV